MSTNKKESIRNQILASLGELTGDTIAKGSVAIAERLFDTTWWQHAQSVYCFRSIEGEVDTHPIIHRALADHKSVAAPRIEGSELVFYSFKTLTNGFVSGPYGIWEPDPCLPTLNQRVDPCRDSCGAVLLITPGLAFDRRKNRLGRGGGYYDRFLAAVRTAKKSHCTALAVCFRSQILEQVPCDNNRDQPVDAIITEDEVIC